MKLKILILFLFPLSILAQQTTRCSHPPVTDPDYIQQQAELELLTQNWIKKNKKQAAAREVLTIPVVVHIVYSNEEENIPDQQVYDQMAVLNEDYRFLNANTDLIPTEFKDLAADVGIEFCLVNQDPFGESTSGITRTFTNYACIGNTVDSLGDDGKPRLFFSDKGGKDIWDSNKYLNIYVANTCGRFLGRAKLPNTVSPLEDAPVIDYKYFGDNCTIDSRPFHLGRTTTHEVGHFFNLNHTFGDATGCEQDDLVADTPLQDAAYFGCPTYPKISCNSSDLFMNFMDFVDDRCMKLFTTGQKNRMLATLLDENGPRRGLLENNLCAAPPTPPAEAILNVAPNPVSDCIHFELESSFSGKVSVRLFDALGKLVYEREENAFALKQINTGHLMDGIYFLILEYGDERISKKVMKASF